MDDLVSQYLFMRKSRLCQPFLLPKYYTANTLIGRDPLTVEAVKLRCFMQNHLPHTIGAGSRSEIRAAIINWNIRTPEELITYLSGKKENLIAQHTPKMYDSMIAGIQEVRGQCTMCNSCNKNDWSGDIGKLYP